MRVSVRNTLSSLILASSVGLVGCLDMASSLNPAFPLEGSVPVEGIEGFWHEGDTGLSIRSEGVGVYEMVVWEKGAPLQDHAPFALRFGRIGDDVYWDITPKIAEPALGIRLVHLPARVRLEDGVLEIAFLTQAGVRQALESGQLTLAHAMVDDKMVLTGSTAELEAFLQEHGGNEELFDEALTFHKQRRPRR